MEIIFLGTGPAWGLPEFLCECQICKHMRRLGEARTRSAIMLKTNKNILLDCGPDIKMQLERNNITHIDSVLISHEHNDHYMGLDDLFPFKRTKPRDEFIPIELFCSEQTYAEISKRFKYLESFGVLKPNIIREKQWYQLDDIEFMPFKTYHGDSAKGSVGFLIRFLESKKTLVYTSDMMDIPQFSKDLERPDYLIIQSFWLNEPEENRPKHLSFQRALDFIKLFDPQRACFLVHMGDGDSVQGDPQNKMLKKYLPKDPLRPPKGAAPYPIPTCHVEWQLIVDTIRSDYGLDWPIYVARDNYKLCLI